MQATQPFPTFDAMKASLAGLIFAAVVIALVVVAVVAQSAGAGTAPAGSGGAIEVKRTLGDLYGTGAGVIEVRRDLDDLYGAPVRQIPLEYLYHGQ